MFFLFYPSEKEPELSRPLYPDFTSDDEEVPQKSSFKWKDRLALVEILAFECADNGGKYDQAFKSIRLSDFAYFAAKMPVKQKSLLKKEVIKRSADICYMRDAASVGDIVRVPKWKENPLLGGYIRDGRKLVLAEIISKVMISSSYRYTVRRLNDGMIQKGNGHMIKGIASYAGETMTKERG